MVKKVLYLFTLLLLSLLLPTQAQAALPSDFQKTTVVSGFAGPTDFAFVPDGRIIVLEKGGAIKIVSANGGTTTTALTLPVDTVQERGLLGVALDPNFGQNGYVYIYYTNKSPLENRVSRFTLSGSTININTEKVLLRSTQALGPVHHAGTVRFGPDGKLWISVGNNVQPTTTGNAQDLSNIHGKILRINSDGTIPSDNPFVGMTGRNPAIWAYGFRNPFRFSFLPDGRPIVGDVGESTYEEINIIQKGGNYGWPNQEGPCNGCAYINPYFSYAHTAGQSSSITGGFVYKKPATGGFPASYDNNYIYGDYAANNFQGFLHMLQRDSNGNFVSDQSIDEAAGNVVELLEHPDGSVYYLDILAGAIFKVAYNPGAVVPQAKAAATPIAGLSPLTVSFSSAGSQDPQGRPLTYLWNFGDGTGNDTRANPTHTYTKNGTYTATLLVNNGQSLSNPVGVTITVGNRLPVPQITTPTANNKYNAGQTISFAGSATDPEDGTLPASDYSWTIVFHHSVHTHPFLGPITGVKNGTFVIPDSGEVSAETSYELLLTVTDNGGLKQTTSTTIKPNVVTLTFTSQPVAGLTVLVDGQPHQTPYTQDSVVGFKHSIDVASPQQLSNNSYNFAFWSTGGNKTQVVTTPSTNTTYEANFNTAGTGLGHIHFRIREYDENGTATGKFLNNITAKLTDTDGNTVFAQETSKTVNGQDGWVYFDYQIAGNYGILASADNYKGFWKQTNCTTGGTTTGATITNKNTGNLVGTWQSPVGITGGQITWCKDVGLKIADKGNLFLRVRLVERDPAYPGDPNYVVVGALNGATAKLTDVTGKTVVATAVSAFADGADGWVKFTGIKAGTYGVLAYKPGYKGTWKQIGCVSYAAGAQITNENTNNIQAAWNDSVDIVGGTTTYCRDLGLIGTANIHFRVRDIDSNGNWTGKFLNGATAKLTDPTGTLVYATQQSNITNTNDDGWVFFDNVEAGAYSILAYQQGKVGMWRQTDCSSGASTTNVTITNTNTDGQVAAWQENFHADDGKVTYCKDLGLSVPKKGILALRVREFDATNNWTGKFLNGATVVLTDPTGATIKQATTSATFLGEDGWARFTNVPQGSYGVLAYQQGFSGVWKQADCTVNGSTTDATIQNGNTGGQLAAWDNAVTITADQTTWCQDLGLKNNTVVKVGHIGLRIREMDASGKWTGKFINGAQAKLTDTSGNTVVSITTSAPVNGNEDGWVFFNNVPEGNYGVLAYKTGFKGIWRQTECGPGGTTDSATINNGNTQGQIAAWTNSITVVASQTTWCRDLGVTSGATASVNTTISEQASDSAQH